MKVSWESMDLKSINVSGAVPVYNFFNQKIVQ